MRLKQLYKTCYLITFNTGNWYNCKLWERDNAGYQYHCNLLLLHPQQGSTVL